MLLTLLRTSGLPGVDALVVRQRIGDEVDRVVGAPHRPVAVVALVGEQLGVGLRGEVGDPQVGRVAAAIVLARPDRRMAVEDERLAVGREAARSSPSRPAAAAPGRRRPAPRRASRRSGTRRRRARRGTARCCESRVQPTTSSLPVWNVSRRGAPPVGGIDEDVVVAVAVRRERDPPAVGREARVDLARDVVGEPRAAPCRPRSPSRCRRGS